MNIKEIIGKVMVNLDEVTSSNLTANAADYIYKIYPLIDTIQTEIATTIKPIKKYISANSVNKRINLPADCYEFLKVYDADMIPVNFMIYDGVIIMNDLLEDSTFNLHYNKYPTVININTPDITQLEIDKDCQEALVYGVTAGLCINDEPELYATYQDRYTQMITTITARMQNNSVARLVGGIRL